MKNDDIQYFYSPSANYAWFLEINKPEDAIAMTLKMEHYYEINKKNKLVIIKNSNFELNSFDDDDIATYPFQMVEPNSLLTPEELNNKIISQKTYELLVLINEYKQYSIPAIYRQLSSEEQHLLDDYIDNLFSLLNNLTIDTVIPDKLELSIKNILG